MARLHRSFFHCVRLRIQLHMQKTLYEIFADVICRMHESGGEALAEQTTRLLKLLKEANASIEVCVSIPPTSCPINLNKLLWVGLHSVSCRSYSRPISCGKNPCPFARLSLVDPTQMMHFRHLCSIKANTSTSSYLPGNGPVAACI